MIQGLPTVPSNLYNIGPYLCIERYHLRYMGRVDDGFNKEKRAAYSGSIIVGDGTESQRLLVVHG